MAALRPRAAFPLLLVAVIAATGAAAAPAAAEDASVAKVAGALRHGSVYVSAAADPALSAAQARRVAREVAKRDRGRIKVVLVSQAEASHAGGVAALANDLDKQLDAPGTVFVTAGSRSWLVTSFEGTTAA